MRALMVESLSGPSGVKVVETAEPRGDGVLVHVAAVGISWPDLLQSKGEYQLKPELPFVLGVDFAGTVMKTGHGWQAGDRVACVLPYGGGAEQVVVPPDAVFALPDAVSFEKGAAIPMNYLTADFALNHRGQLKEGQTVLVHGAAGGVGTATLQVAAGMGLRTIGVVSTDSKAAIALKAGANDAVLADGFRDAVRRIAPKGVDAIVDVVGGDLFTDSLRCLAEDGRLLVVGFTGGSIPEVKVNRLLLNNIDVRGVGWGAYAMVRPGFMRDQWERLIPMMESGVIDPPIGDTRPVEEATQALQDMADRKTLGKTVLTF